MTWLHLILLALIQGITEFLPVSSSGHLILLPKLLGAQDQGPILDVAVHIGTLSAVMLYYRRDVWQLIIGSLDVLRGRTNTDAAHLFLLLAISTIPVIIAGLLIKTLGIMDDLRRIDIIGATMIGFGIVLYLADRFGKHTREASEWTLKHAIIMGLWQVLALIPGTSRSGATISGARALGYSRIQSAKLAMLMSIPTIMASGLLLGADVVIADDRELLQEAAIAALMSAIAALIALSLMIRLLRHISFTPYVIYRIILGIVLLVIAYG